MKLKLYNKAIIKLITNNPEIKTKKNFARIYIGGIPQSDARLIIAGQNGTNRENGTPQFLKIENPPKERDPHNSISNMENLPSLADLRKTCLDSKAIRSLVKDNEDFTDPNCEFPTIVQAESYEREDGESGYRFQVVQMEAYVGSDEDGDSITNNPALNNRYTMYYEYGHIDRLSKDLEEYVGDVLTGRIFTIWGVAPHYKTQEPFQAKRDGEPVDNIYNGLFSKHRYSNDPEKANGFKDENGTVVPAPDKGRMDLLVKRAKGLLTENGAVA